MLALTSRKLGTPLNSLPPSFLCFKDVVAHRTANGGGGHTKNGAARGPALSFQSESEPFIHEPEISDPLCLLIMLSASQLSPAWTGVGWGGGGAWGDCLLSLGR